MKRTIRQFIGWLSLFVGLIGFLLPVLPGFALFFLGLIILTPEVPFFQRLLQRLEDRYPNVFTRAHQWGKRLDSWLHGRGSGGK